MIKITGNSKRLQRNPMYIYFYTKSFLYRNIFEHIFYNTNTWVHSIPFGNQVSIKRDLNPKTESIKHQQFCSYLGSYQFKIRTLTWHIDLCHNNLYFKRCYSISRYGKIFLTLTDVEEIFLSYLPFWQV